MTAEIASLRSTLDGSTRADEPREVLALAMDRYEHIALSFSGAEDVVLIDMAAKLGADIAVFTLDTGRLHPETYRFLDTVRARYQLDLEILFPDTASVQSLVREQGLFDFYERGHKACCQVRKVGPLRHKLSTLDAWITGQRRDQSAGTRNELASIERDAAFNGRNGPLVKFNPLAHWSSADVWTYIRVNDVPYNPLHERGYVSIGCEPCTRGILPGQHEREGRWWWEDVAQKECGLHAGNLRKAG